MRVVTLVRCVLACLMGVAAASCGADKSGITGPGNPGPINDVRLESDVGDYIGGGQTYDYTQANATITVTAQGGHLSIGIAGDEGWSGDFQMPSALNQLQDGLWRPAPGSTPSTGNYVYLQSDAGDYIGGGATTTYTPATASIGVTVSGGHLSVSVASWSGDFQAMTTLSEIEAGYYADLRRYPFHNPVKGGLSW